MGIPLIQTLNLKKYFPFEKSLFRVKSHIRAVDDINISFMEKEIVGLVGESGSGKTTLGRLLAKLEEPTDGAILFKSENITKLNGRRLKQFRRKVQMVFQNPYTSFDPRYDMKSSLSEPIDTHSLASSEEEKLEVISKALEEVGLTPAQEFLHRFPNEMSGGQLQRASVARALLLEPEFLIADEPTSMLDASLRVGVLNLIQKMKLGHGITTLFITHDIATAKHICDRIVVLYQGKVVEDASTEETIENPLHPYTKALMSSVLSTDLSVPELQVKIKGEPQILVDPKGCRLAPRCPYYVERCKSEEPRLSEASKSHYVACHRWKELPD